MASVIVSSIGSNLDGALYERFNIALTPLSMSVDGKTIEHTRLRSYDDIDEFIKTAQKYPHSLGTSAAEFMQAFTELQKTYDEIIVVTTSKRTIGTYDAAVAAARTLKTMSSAKTARIHVIDAGTIDLGVGLVTLFAAKSLSAGRGGRELIDAAESVGRAGRVVYTTMTLDHMVRGGRASFIAQQAAELFNRRPLVGFQDGQNKSLGTISKSADYVAAIVDELKKTVGAGQPVWAGVMHASAPDDAKRLGTALRGVFDVREMLTREMTAGVYLYVGRGAIGAFVTPCANMAWPVALKV